MFNNLNILFLILVIFSTIFSISSPSWLAAWMGLELNMISFISFIISSKNILSNESALKYFLIQAMASSSFITLCLMNSFSFFSMYEFNMSFFMNTLIIIPLMMKLGAAPFHFWFISMMEGLSWMKCFILMTWQKITPLFILFYFIQYKNLLVMFIYMSLMLGMFGGLNQTSFKKLLAYSSINHLGWLLIAAILAKQIMIFYFFFYFMLNFLLIMLLNTFGIFSFNQINNIKQTSFFFLAFTSTLLSLGGLPPFLGFLPKWIMLQALIQNDFMFLTVLLICLTLIILFFYIRMIFNYMMLFYSLMKWQVHFPLYLSSPLNFFLASSFLFSSFGLFLFNLTF